MRRWRTLTNHAWRLGVIAGLLFLVWLRWHQPPNTVDDAYTTFRYARNLANGVGFVFNPGERVLGTTTPAYAMLLALASSLSGYQNFPVLAVGVNTLFNTLAFALAARLTARLSGSRWAGLGAGWLLALEGRLLDFATGGMESSFYVATILATWLLWVNGRTRWAALMAGLAVLIRPDGLLLAGVVGAGLLWPVITQPRRWPWAEAALMAAVVLPWVGFALAYFGTPIPQSVSAKAQLYRVPELMAFKAFLVQLRALFPFSLPPLAEGQDVWRSLAQVTGPGVLLALGLRAAHQRFAGAWWLGVWWLAFIAFYSLGNPLWLGWYEIPLMPLYHVTLMVTAAWAGQWLAGRGWSWALPVTLTAMFGLLAVPHLSRLNVIPWEQPQRAAWTLNTAFNKRREFDYALLAHMLAPAARADRLVAIPEIGAFGYHYPGRLFDTSGLISPEIDPYFPIPAEIPIEIYSVPRQMLFDLRPDWFIAFDSFIQATIPLDDAEFLALYRPTIGLTSRAAFGLQRLMTYRRADLPSEVALPPQATPTAVTFGETLTLRGYWVLSAADRDNQYADLILFWQGPDRPITDDLLIRAQLRDDSGAVLYEILNQPGEAFFPTPAWTPGFWLVDRYALKRPPQAGAAYTLAVTVFSALADDPLPAQSAGQPLPENVYTIRTGPLPLARP